MTWAFVTRWWSWIWVQFHRAQHIYCAQWPITTLMYVPPDPEADERAAAGFAEGAEADLARMAVRAGRARVRAYACGGCRYGHD